jgi:O-antigen biosynthesis protein
MKSCDGSFDSVLSQKDVFVILGMARSGTSVISRGLKALGIDLGNKLTPDSKWNPKGFWEDNDIVYKINERVLTTLNYSWDTARLIDNTHLIDGTLHDVEHLAVELLKQRTRATQYWAFKDPRTVKILPFWQAVFKTANVNDHYVIALRNPLSSAQSYKKLTEADIEHGLILWLVHLLASVDGTKGKHRMIVSYDLMMQNPRLQLERMKTGLNIPSLSDASEIDTYVDGFLDKNLHHYEYSMDDLRSHEATAVAPLCLKIYEWLLKIATDEITFDNQAFLSGWQNIRREFDIISPFYSYIDTLLQRNHHLTASIRTLHKSRLWKLLYPLRAIDDALRSCRKKRKKKRLLGIHD